MIDSGNKGISLGPAMLEAKAQEAIIAFETHSRVVLAVGRPLIRRPIVARRLAQYLVKIAVRVLKRAEVDRVYAEGGATAAEFVRQLGWSRLKVLQELAPGRNNAGVGRPPLAGFNNQTRQLSRLAAVALNAVDIDVANLVLHKNVRAIRLDRSPHLC